MGASGFYGFRQNFRIVYHRIPLGGHVLRPRWVASPDVKSGSLRVARLPASMRAQVLIHHFPPGCTAVALCPAAAVIAQGQKILKTGRRKRRRKQFNRESPQFVIAFWPCGSRPSTSATNLSLALSAFGNMETIAASRVCWAFRLKAFGRSHFCAEKSDISLNRVSFSPRPPTVNSPSLRP